MGQNATAGQVTQVPWKDSEHSAPGQTPPVSNSELTTLRGFEECFGQAIVTRPVSHGTIPVTGGNTRSVRVPESSSGSSRLPPGQARLSPPARSTSVQRRPNS